MVDHALPPPAADDGTDGITKSRPGVEIGQPGASDFYFPLNSLPPAGPVPSMREGRALAADGVGDVGNGDQSQEPWGSRGGWTCFARRRRLRPVGPLPLGQKNALLNDIEDNLTGNHANLLKYLDWSAVILQTSFSAVATALAGFTSSRVPVITLTASATVAGAVIALFKNSGEPQLSMQRNLELTHLKLKVEAVDHTSSDAATSLVTLRQEYEIIDKQTSSAYVGVTSPFSSTTPAVPPA
ncbi:hypothetical protein V1525DRAFT_72753 [Lipomyces kononenkoae]|uniref:Uncharacterized protein n=1 Tax=Lipomyces kononenkoae TaxID=34357 RepID=A0ACC3SRL0_LIPKO